MRILGGKLMGSLFNKKCNQIDSLINLYCEYEKTTTQEDRDESIQKILFLIREIKLDEEWV